MPPSVRVNGIVRAEYAFSGNSQRKIFNCKITSAKELETRSSFPKPRNMIIDYILEDT